MIEGVKVKGLKLWIDDRGYVAEIIRNDEKLLSRFGQATITKTHPGVIKAFHWHKKQDDLWYVVAGHIQAVLYDQRAKSSTHGQRDVYYLGEDNHSAVLIPRGVAHGYRVLGNCPATVIYLTTESYNPKRPDEERIPFDDKKINFDWRTKNR